MDGRFLLKLINACLLCLGVAHADPGVDWLSAQSNQDGSYARADDVATPYQATSESLRTFTALGLSASPRVPAARAFVQAQTHKSTETLARKIIVRADAGLDAARLVSALSGLQNPDGGFGELTGYDSTVLDTALALDALSSAGKLSSPAAGRALGFLVGRQHADGGWSAGDDSHSVYVSALALRALWLSRRAYSLAAAIQHGRGVLLDAAGKTLASDAARYFVKEDLRMASAK